MEQTEKKEATTLVVTRELRDWLDNEGERNETFDDIIKRKVGFKCKKE